MIGHGYGGIRASGHYSAAVSTSTLQPSEAETAEPPAPSALTDPVRTAKIVALVSVAVPTLLIFIVMSGMVYEVRASDVFPYLDVSFGWPALFAANTPTGGDMGAHVLLPQYLQDTLLPQGRILGWSNDWYAGYPALYFYFPLPALVTVFLNVFLPYGVAFKIVTMLGLVALPTAIYFFVRSMGFSRVVSSMATVVGSGYVFMESFSIFGANIKSTLAGEFSFSWSFALSLLYLGQVIRDTRAGRGFTPRAGIFLALTALSHIITTMVVVVVSLPLLLRRNGLRSVTRAWVIGFSLAAFWALPLAIRVFQGMTSDMNWDPVKGMIGDGSSGSIATPIPGEFVPILALGIIGLVWSLLRRQDVAVLAAMTTLPLLGYWVLQFDQVDLTKLYNARLLPYWYLGVFIFAGIAVGLALREVARYLPDRTRNVAFGATVVVVLFANLVFAGVHDIPGWVRWNYTGYEEKAAWPEYEAIMETADGLPPGRIMWEANSDEMGKYGTPMAFMLFPYWTEGHPSMEGLFFESSLTTPFHFLNAAEVSLKPSNPVRGINYHSLDFARALPHLELYGVDYYMAWTDEATGLARAAGLEEVAASEPVTFFRIPHRDLVEPATYQPVVYDGDLPFADAALEWYDDIDNLDRWMVADGPEEWPRVDDQSERIDVAQPIQDPAVATAEVTDIEVDDHRISFRTTAVGVPHLIKVSYFPAWQAHGADGPYRAAPSLMIVVPTEEDVVIEFANGVPENVGMVLSVTAIFGLAGWGYRRRKQRLS